MMRKIAEYEEEKTDVYGHSGFTNVFLCSEFCEKILPYESTWVDIEQLLDRKLFPIHRLILNHILDHQGYKEILLSDQTLLRLF